MSRSFLILIYLLSLYSLAIGQDGDTLYFDKKWAVCKKQEAKYYRLIQQVDGAYIIQDFYKNDVLQMRVTATSIIPQIFEGQCFYYQSNGNLKASGMYNKGKPVGIWNYYNSNGYLTNTFNYNSIIDSNDITKKIDKMAISKADNKFSFALRGKLFGFFIIEDTYFSTATLGGEFLLKGRHSLGIDYTYFGWQYEKDDDKDMALYETFERRGYFYFDYKYKFLSNKDYDFYFNIYDKIGNYHLWLQGVSKG
ncbi:MAG: hypothetical protein H0U95_05690 [Bacteroidetes bacterium]|nr:hypothetical protein [Bacteroidota bacterium]